MQLLYFALMGLAAMPALGQPAPMPDDTNNTEAIESRQSYIGQSCTNTYLVGNPYGTCQYTSTCTARTGNTDPHPDCPGPADVQCCAYDDCINGAKGTCLDTRQFNCQGNGGFNYGNYCPGGDTYICCQGDYWRKGGPRPLI